MKEKNEKDVLRGNSHQENSMHNKNNEHQEIKTDTPLSEKDEVKQAEERAREIVKNGD